MPRYLFGPLCRCIGSRVFTCRRSDCTIRVWSSTTFLPITVFPYSHPPICIAYSPDGMRVASGTRDGFVCVQNKQEIVSSSSRHTKSVSSLVFTPDGRQIISGSWDGTLRLWDSFTVTLIKLVDVAPSGCIFSLTISPSGRQLVAAFGEGGLLSWMICNGDLIPDQMPPIGVDAYSVAFASGGKSLVLHTSNAPYFYDLLEQRLIPFPYDGRPLPVPPSPTTSSHDGSRVTFGDGHNIRVCGIPEAGISATTLSPYGNVIVYTFLDNTVELWDPQRGFFMGHRLRGHLQHVAFSFDNALIAGVCDEKDVYLWNVATQELLHSASGIPEELPPVVSISFLADRRTVMTTQ